MNLFENILVFVMKKIFDILVNLNNRLEATKDYNKFIENINGLIFD